VRVSDISVSRCHAFLKYGTDHCFYLEDNFSKFGTLVLQHHSVELNLEDNKVIQIGRSVITFHLRQNLQKQLKTPSPMHGKKRIESNNSCMKLETYLQSNSDEEEKPIQDYYVSLEDLLHSNPTDMILQ